MRAAARVMDVGVARVPADEHGRMHRRRAARGARRATRRRLRGRRHRRDHEPGSSTTSPASAEVCREHDVWLHVDGAYGARRAAAPSVRGAVRRDRAGRLAHRRPAQVAVRARSTVRAAVPRPGAGARGAHASARLPRRAPPDDDWNPSDYAFHLTRRARGLPFWFSLAVHGTEAYRRRRAHARGHARGSGGDPRPRRARAGRRARALDPRVPPPRLVRGGPPPLGRRSCAKRDGVRLPDTVRGETVARLALVNPRTTVEDLRVVLDTMRG